MGARRCSLEALFILSPATDHDTEASQRREVPKDLNDQRQSIVMYSIPNPMIICITERQYCDPVPVYLPMCYPPTLLDQTELQPSGG